MPTKVISRKKAGVAVTNFNVYIFAENLGGKLGDFFLQLHTTI
jgi:hypothetical protein